MPDDESIRFWQQMATRFRHNPLVAFDLYNEPHGITDSVWLDGGSTTSFGVTYHGVGVRQLYQTIRATGARNLVFIGGNAYATVFPGTAPLAGTTNVVYAAHAYTCPHDIPSRGGDCHGGPGGFLDPSHILDRFVAAGAQLPVVVTEFGWPDPKDGTYVSNVIRFVQSHGWAGWAAFVVNGGTRGLFNLVGHVGHYWQPSPVGMAAIAAMTGD